MFGARSSVGILLSVLLSSICLPVSDESNFKPADARPRLVSAEEGEAIVQAAWELRRGLIPKPDCSHFVQAVYARAGFPYEYAASRDIFAGIDGFRKVKKPQAGDIVVWPGHIGIVIDAREHSFYSSVLSGFAIENYQSNYWIVRGNPRFYRLVVNNSPAAPGPVFSSLAQARLASDQVPLRLTQPFPASAQPSGLTVEAYGRQPAHIAAQAPAPIKANSPVHIKSEAPAQIEAQARAQITAQAPTQIKAQAPSPIIAKAEAAPVATTNAAIHNEVLVTSRAIPSRREVLAAIIRSADDNGERLLQNSLLDSQPSVGVVDQFRIVSLDFEDNLGLADLEVNQIAAFRYGTVGPYRSTTRQRVILSRQAQGWILLDPQNLVFLNRRLAAVALSHQLATMSQAPAGQLDVRKAVKILHELLSDKSARADAGGSD
jgi:cell wall-associated NlpC family hydrolase